MLFPSLKNVEFESLPLVSNVFIYQEYIFRVNAASVISLTRGGCSGGLEASLLFSVEDNEVPLDVVQTLLQLSILGKTDKSRITK